jgi:hypothetical protein
MRILVAIMAAACQLLPTMRLSAAQMTPVPRLPVVESMPASSLCPDDQKPQNPIVEILPDPAQKYPVVPDESLTAGQLAAMHGEDEVQSQVYGLTGPKRDADGKPRLMSWDYSPETRKSRLGDGLCFWIDRIRIVFPPISVRVARELTNRRCAHAVTLEHEYRHAAEMERILRANGRELAQDIARLDLPSRGRQLYVASREDAETQAEQRINNVVRHYRAKLAKELKDANALLDTPEQYKAEHDRCTDWP